MAAGASVAAMEAPPRRCLEKVAQATRGQVTLPQLRVALPQLRVQLVTRGLHGHLKETDRPFPRKGEHAAAAL